MRKNPRLVLFFDNQLGYNLAKYLKQKRENVVGLVFDNKNKTPFKVDYKTKIKKIFKLSKNKIFDWTDLSKKKYIEKLKELDLDFFICVNFPKILNQEIISCSRNSINLHLSYLPFNRGKNPNVWSIIENTPCGATIHKIDEKIDTGKIYARKKILPNYTDTAETIYEKCNIVAQELFRKKWDKIKKNKIKPTKQNNKYKTFHLSKNFRNLGLIELNKKYKAKEIINLLRAKTFKNFESAYFFHKGKKIEIRVKLNFYEK
tara:strand:- start:5519 stop:6298 length:780 start_codon:yes stop_codon:yes gene_type:complete